MFVFKVVEMGVEIVGYDYCFVVDILSCWFGI